MSIEEKLLPTTSIILPISIIICTYNRANLLRIAVESVLGQEVTPDSYELIIVDNNSSDGTRETVEQLSRERKNVHYVFEEKQGLSYARNTGWREARGDYVLYIDDECLLPAGYLGTALQIIQNHNPDIFGGPIKAYYNFERPHWVKDEYYSAFLDRKTGMLTQGEFVYGGNMGIRKTLLNLLDGFNTDLGMRGNQLAFAEEVEFQQRAIKSDPSLKIYFDSKLWLYHHVRREKVDLRQLLRYHFSSGLKGIVVFNEIQIFDKLPAHRKLTWFFRRFELILKQMIRICTRVAVLLFRRDEKYPYWQQYMFERILSIEINNFGVHYGVFVHCLRSQLGKKTYGNT